MGCEMILSPETVQLPMLVVKVVSLHGTATTMLIRTDQHTRVPLTDICTTCGYYWPQGPHNYVSGYPGYYYYPNQFGFRWSEIDSDTSPSYGSYPYHYWGYYYHSYHGGQGVYKPIEGYNGYGGYYNICLDYASRYWMNPGEGARMTFPIVDISDSSISAGNHVRRRSPQPCRQLPRPS